MSENETKVETAVTATTENAETAATVAAGDEDENVTRELTQTEKFYEKLKLNLQTLLEAKLKDKRLSRKMAAKVMRECLDTAAEFTAELPDMKLPIIGIGRFYIAMSKARQFPGKPSIYAGLEKVPHFRWKPSSRYFNYLLEKICGVKADAK